MEQDLSAVRDYYAERPDFFVFKTADDLPPDLPWQNGQHLPELGSPEARKGGTFYQAMADFPRTLRWIGPDANSHFRAYLLDDTMVMLGRRHPNNYEIYPGLAREWAVSREEQTVYVRIDPAARWSDGEPVTSDDFLYLFYFTSSPYTRTPWYSNFYNTLFTRITRYDELTFAVTMIAAKPDFDVWVMEMLPLPEHFFGEIREDFIARYNWRFWPTTGPYVVADGGLRKGRSITLTRLQNWWARERKFFRHRFNPDRVHVSVIRDRAKTVEAFRRGDIDLLHINAAEDWYERFPDADPDIQAGYLNKVQFYFQHPLTLRGLYMNTTRKPLDNRELRLGIQYASNFQLVIDKLYRGDYRRLHSANDGFGEFSHSGIRARPFDPARARTHFAAAGYAAQGADGVLQSADGARLSFTLTYGDDQDTDLVTILKQEALKAGLEFRLEHLDRTAAWKKVQEKKHEIQYTGFSQFLEMYPRYWEGWHSAQAYDRAFLADGSVNPERKAKPQTNNYEGVAIAQVDRLIEAYDRSSNRDEMIALGHRIEELLHENAAFVPGAARDFYRVAFWRWVRFPEGFNVRHSQYAHTYWLHWIDQPRRQATSVAREQGTTFEPLLRVYDQYRVDDDEGR